MDDDNNSDNGGEGPSQPRRHGSVHEGRHCVIPGCDDRQAGVQRELTWFQRELTRVNDELRTSQAEVDRQTRKCRELVEENERLKKRLAPGGLHTTRTWGTMLRVYLGLLDPDDIEDLELRAKVVGRGYAEIWKQSAREENMSTKVKLRHPDINFVAGAVVVDEEESEDSEEGSEEDGEASEDSDDVSDESDEVSKISGKASEGVKDGLVAVLNVFGGMSLRASTPEPLFVREGKPFPFAKLPEFVQLDILKLLLFKEGSLIHCVSRLDSYQPPPPGSFPAVEDPRRSGLRNFFFWGPGKNCVVNTGGHNPAEVLALLQVSKRMLWLGAHIFYGLNTFAFSSLGEFHRFCQGIGVARVERIQHIELCFTGNQYLTAPLYTIARDNENNAAAAALREDKGKVPYSRRTYGLSWLVDMKRLKTMVVHINESHASYMRRKNEHPAMKRLLGNKTKGQPNMRMNRALRTVQGVDYIYQLRGMEWVRWYDLHKALKDENGIRTQVEDWSFERDIGGVVTMPKVPAREEGSRLENLRPLFRGGGGGGDGGGDGDGDGDDGSQGRWKPTEEEWEVVRTCYNLENGRCSYDELREGGGREDDADVASFALGSNRVGRRGDERGGASWRRPGSSVTSSTLSSYTSSRSLRTSMPSSRASALSSRASVMSSRASLFGSRASSPLFVGDDDDDDDLVMLDGRPDDEARRAETEAAMAEELRALMDELPPPDSSWGSMAPPSTSAPRVAQPPQRVASESSGLFVTPRASDSRELSAIGPGRNGSPTIKKESVTPSRMGSVIRGDMGGMIIDLTRDSEDPFVQIFSEEEEGVDDSGASEEDSSESEDSSDDSDDDGGAPLGNLQSLLITPPATRGGRDEMKDGQGSSSNKRGASPSRSESGASKRARSE